MRENEGGVDMALIKCPECGKEISDAAESCPNCGYPIKGQQLKTVLFIVVGIILVVIVLSIWMVQVFSFQVHFLAVVRSEVVG